MTKEEIVEFEIYCKENKVNKKEALKQRSITYWNYYTSKKRLNSEAESPLTKSSGSFIPVVFGGDGSKHEKRSKSRVRRETELAKGNVLTIEMRTSTGTELRIQGQMNISMLREILNASSGGNKNV